jgi:hypothetical protein
MVMTAMSGAVGGISSALIHQALAQRKGVKWDPANIAHVRCHTCATLRLS